MAKSKTVEPLALDPHHPLNRRLVRRLQLFSQEVLAFGALPPRLALLDEVRGQLGEICGHIRKAQPRVEYDESAQERIIINGECIGRLSRPASFPDLLHPMLEAAIERQIAGDDGREGDRDAENECAPADCAGLVEIGA